MVGAFHDLTTDDFADELLLCIIRSSNIISRFAVYAKSNMGHSFQVAIFTPYFEFLKMLKWFLSNMCCELSDSNLWGVYSLIVTVLRGTIEFALYLIHSSIIYRQQCLLRSLHKRTSLFFHGALSSEPRKRRRHRKARQCFFLLQTQWTRRLLLCHSIRIVTMAAAAIKGESLAAMRWWMA